MTDEYVDAVFREIDLNRDNKIQPSELEQYALHFVNQIIPEYEKIQKEKEWTLTAQNCCSYPQEIFYLRYI